jgi:hypothetical protein
MPEPESIKTMLQLHANLTLVNSSLKEKKAGKKSNVATLVSERGFVPISSDEIMAGVSVKTK